MCHRREGWLLAGLCHGWAVMSPVGALPLVLRAPEAGLSREFSSLTSPRHRQVHGAGWAVLLPFAVGHAQLRVRARGLRNRRLCGGRAAGGRGRGAKWRGHTAGASGAGVERPVTPGPRVPFLSHAARTVGLARVGASPASLRSLSSSTSSSASPLLWGVASRSFCPGCCAVAPLPSALSWGVACLPSVLLRPLPLVASWGPRPSFPLPPRPLSWPAGPGGHCLGEEQEALHGRLPPTSGPVGPCPPGPGGSRGASPRAENWPLSPCSQLPLAAGSPRSSASSTG